MTINKRYFLVVLSFFAVALTLVVSARDFDKIEQTDERGSLEGLIDLFKGLEEMGLKKVPPVANSLKEAIDSQDHGAIRRAFHNAIYGRFSEMEESIPAISAYLDATEPYLRFLAAETLVKVGEPSALKVLINFAISEEAILFEGNDLRLPAARLLGRYGNQDAASALSSLYRITKKGSVLNAWVRVEGRQAGEELIKKVISFPAPGFVAANLGLIANPETDAIIKEIFDEPKVPEIYVLETKMLAAWALARTTGQKEYIDYLVERARPTIESEDDNGFTYGDSEKALRYLGSIESPRVIQILEDALQSKNPVAVRCATVNLMFNSSGDARKAENLVLSEFENSPKILGTELAMQIASKYDSKRLKSAAESYSKRVGSDRWRYWGEERGAWPLENWIFDYVIVIDSEP